MIMGEITEPRGRAGGRCCETNTLHSLLDRYRFSARGWSDARGCREVRSLDPLRTAGTYVAGLLVPWITFVGALGFLAAWLVMAILERTGLSRHVWHLPLFFVALLVLFSSLIGAVFFP